MNKIVFHSNTTYNNKNLIPTSTSKKIPKWYSLSKFYIKDKNTNEDFITQEGHKVPNFKACPALLDSFTAGYFLTTPCDIEFYKQDGFIRVKTEPGYESFCGERLAMEGFPTPENYQDFHFHWYPNWGIETPDGYSAMYLHPINRFDLPFITVSGIVDNDKFDTPGLIPFFINKNFIGVIPKGTPYLQVIPFKREDWENEFKLYDQDKIIKRNQISELTLRFNQVGAYKKKMWSRKKYL